MSGDAERYPQFQGAAHVQYNGKKKFVPVWLQLTDAGQLEFRPRRGEPVHRSGCVLGCSVGAPNSARKGHAHAIRLDLAEPDSEGVPKFVVSLGSKGEKDHWVECLRAYADLTAADLEQPEGATAPPPGGDQPPTKTADKRLGAQGRGQAIGQPKPAGPAMTQPPSEAEDDAGDEAENGGQELDEEGMVALKRGHRLRLRRHACSGRDRNARRKRRSRR
jgi:hypothetical protein